MSQGLVGLEFSRVSSSCWSRCLKVLLVQSSCVSQGPVGLEISCVSRSGWSRVLMNLKVLLV